VYRLRLVDAAKLWSYGLLLLWQQHAKQNYPFPKVASEDLLHLSGAVSVAFELQADYLWIAKH
jgi:hypothetical protein